MTGMGKFIVCACVCVCRYACVYVHVLQVIKYGDHIREVD